MTELETYNCYHTLRSLGYAVRNSNDGYHSVRMKDNVIVSHLMPEIRDVMIYMQGYIQGIGAAKNEETESL